MNMNYGLKGRALTEHFEGVRLDAYLDSVGVPTIGFGHTGHGVALGQKITLDQAVTLLLADIAHCVSCVNESVHVALTQNQFDALVDFVFNVGAANFMSSTLLRMLNAGNYTGAAGEFDKWAHAGGKVLPGLLARREAEESLYLSAAADTGVTFQLVLSTIQWARLARAAGLFRKAA